MRRPVARTVLVVACAALSSVSAAQKDKGRTRPGDAEVLTADAGNLASAVLDNVREYPQNYPLKKLVELLDKHNYQLRFRVEWYVQSGPLQTECRAEYNRKRRTLDFYANGVASDSGPYIRSHYLFTNVTDAAIRKVASLKTYSKSSTVHWLNRKNPTGNGPDRPEDDTNFLPWFNELRQYGCKRRKMRWKLLRY